MTRKELHDDIHTPRPGESVNEFVKRVKREDYALAQIELRLDQNIRLLEPLPNDLLGDVSEPFPSIAQADQHGQERSQSR